MSRSASKRLLEEYDVSNMQDSKHAKMHGVMTQLSPMKTPKKDATRRCFDGSLSDGKETVRLYRFNYSLEKR